MHPLFLVLCLTLVTSAVRAQPVPDVQRAATSAESLVFQANALQQAAEAFHASQGHWPATLEALRASGSLDFLAAPAEQGSGWSMPAAAVPLFVLPIAGQVDLCARVNKLGGLAREAVTKQGYAQFQTQCFGRREGALKVVSKASVAKNSLSGLPFPQVSWAGPPMENRDPAWLRAPASR